MNAGSFEGSCPLCGEANACAMAAEPRAESACWCTALKFPAELLASVPPGARGTVCICRRCVAAATGSTVAVASKP
ncbi:MAG TPA: cysteine-rich CWC family protein [Burkholderiaceae bacterium]|nr:cysteine-rich CWC family protein [Burkholderiaceae bacterium]